MTVINPPVRDDGLCAGCGGSREKKRTHKGDNKDGARLEASFWRAAVERDPFCSRACCERFHGEGEKPREAVCEGCGVSFVVPAGGRSRKRRFCTPKCQSTAANRNAREVRLERAAA